MFTKRHLGLLLTALGISAGVAILAVDWIGAGEFNGIGPAQQWALAASGLLTLLGISLIPLGDQPL